MFDILWVVISINHAHEKKHIWMYSFIHSFIRVSPLKIRNTSKYPLCEGPLHFEVTQLHNAHCENVQNCFIWIASPHKLIHIDFPFIFMSKEQCHVTLRNKTKRRLDFIQHLIWRVSFRPHFCSSVHFWYKLKAVQYPCESARWDGMEVPQEKLCDPPKWNQSRCN